MEFLADIIATFIGAMLAFFFALILFLFQKKSAEGKFLSFTIAYITSQIGRLYSFKSDISAPRAKEISEIEGKINSPEENVGIQVKEISKTIVNSSHTSSLIDLEKLAFLNDFDPNIFLLVKAAIEADYDVNHVILTCNEEILRNRDEFNFQNLSMLIQVNKTLNDQIDFSLAMLEKAQEELINFSKIEFQPFVIIKSIKLGEKYKVLSPTLKNSWSDVKYDPKSLNLKKKIFTFLKKLITCW